MMRIATWAFMRLGSSMISRSTQDRERAYAESMRVSGSVSSDTESGAGTGHEVQFKCYDDKYELRRDILPRLLTETFQDGVIKASRLKMTKDGNFEKESKKI